MSSVIPPAPGSPLVAAAERWRPRRGWAATVRPAHAALTGGARGVAAAAAWAELAMVAGDTGGPELALIAALAGEAALVDAPDPHVAGRLAAHRDLCLLDLGLGRAAPGPIPLAALGRPGTVAAPVGDLAAWLARALAPFAGDLDRAARYVLALAAQRTGLGDGGKPAP